MMFLTGTGMCEGCLFADLELIKNVAVSGEIYWDVHCNHYKVCKNYFSKIRELEMQHQEKKEGRG